VKEFDIFVPLFYNDGEPIEARKFQKLQARLIKQFGGMTFFPQPNEGFWRVGDVVYHDAIVIYRVYARKPRGARRFLAQVKIDLKRSLRQEEILIVERDVRTH
jgi:hypothetical protein